uniref:Uncharacterized protein n=1 Tax=Arundo donax TaxID=35708 RepID=A0A0A8YMC3_ARUDO
MLQLLVMSVFNLTIITTLFSPLLPCLPSCSW